MDIVFVHKQKQSDEILWSIKSLKNLPHRNIYVIGDPVDVEGVINVEHNPTGWASLSKYHDQISKYLLACNIPALSANFLAINDDMYLMSEWKPINYNRGSLADHFKERNRRDTYSLSLEHTEKLLRQRNKPTLSFELHTPFIYNKKKLKALIESLEPINRPIQIRSLYSNIYGVKTEYMADIKNPTNPEGMKLLSTTEKTFSSSLGNYIKANL